MSKGMDTLKAAAVALLAIAALSLLQRAMATEWSTTPDETTVTQEQEQLQDQAQSTDVAVSGDNVSSRAFALGSKADPATPIDCFIPQTGRRGRGFSTPVFSRPATLMRDAECWEFYKLVTLARLLLDAGETELAVQLLLPDDAAECAERVDRMFQECVEK